jgi:hypothetical protein
MMTTKDVESAYLEWLSGQVRNSHRQQKDKTYWDLMNLLFDKEFVWLIANDDNRVADGLDLRTEFQTQILHTNLWIELWDRGCSVLEVIVALSRRLAFATDGIPEFWAWSLIDNLGFSKMYDPISRVKANRIDEALEKLIYRLYDSDGSGGFFPLAFPMKDQTQVEIWYQMNAYIGELPPH